MLSKKKLVTGVSTLVLGISVVGAAYALPMTNAPMQSENTKAPKATVTVQQDGDTASVTMPVNGMKQNTTGPMTGVNGNNMQDTMAKTMPAGQAMNQQPMTPQMQEQMNSQMNQNSGQMAKYHEQMQQNHQQMNEYHQSNHQAMSQNHRNMSGAAMNGQMGSGHMGFQK